LFVSTLRVHGLRVESARDHFLPGTLDVDWLPVVGARGWIAITQDQLRSDPEEQVALMLHGVKSFVLIGQATHLSLAELFLGKIKSVRRAIEAYQEPFLAKIYVRTGEMNVMTLSQWFAKQHRRRR
jgi:hypothetical protein